VELVKIIKMMVLADITVILKGTKNRYKGPTHLEEDAVRMTVIVGYKVEVNGCIDMTTVQMWLFQDT